MAVPETPHTHHPPYPSYLPPAYRPRPPLPKAPAWLLIAVLAVGVFSSLFAALARPGLGLVLTGVLAGLTALVALLVRPAIPENPVAGTDEDADEDEDAEAESAAVEPEKAEAEEAEATGPDGSDTGPGTEGACGETARGEDTDAGSAEGDSAATAAEDTGAPTGSAAAHPVPPAAPGGYPPPPAWNGWEPAPGGGRRPAGGPVVEEDGGPDRYSHAWAAIFGTIAAALLFTALFRDAGWLLFWTLTGAFLTASLAFAVRGPLSRSGTVGVAAGAFALVRNLFATPRFLLSPLRNSRTRRLLGPALLTALVTGALLMVFGLLFAFADAVFARYLTDLFTPLTETSSFTEGIGRLFFLVLTALFTGSAVLTARRRRPAATARPERESRLPVWAWTIPLGALTALFAAFLAVQAVTLFGGDDHVQRVAGVTYAEYARQGFFQLVAVSILVLGVIGPAARIIPARPRGVRVLRNALLGALCVLTLVILASAMYRLQLYIDVFGLTRLRAVAEAWIVWSALVFGLVIAAGVLNTLGRPAVWLPRVVAATAGVSLAVFAYANPDLRIAESHLGTELNRTDIRYLRDLSADAVPALVRLEGDDRTCVLHQKYDRLGNDGFASWNLSRERAEDLLPPPADPYACVDRYGW
ncbi:DUF4153 domain-containing protein [Nocardiopsis sp. CC223A]|uniref:DUF4153 domain-containing protein n=1 Tax=Nocardiopsis sp. CC223A TaxID=3044051 RepID=UPI00278C402B|nr:DUF4173 domain-containing protein [Nocardiopsis sp. CC223A]